VSTVTENDGEMEGNGREQRGRNDGAPSRSLTSSNKTYYSSCCPCLKKPIWSDPEALPISSSLLHHIAWQRLHQFMSPLSRKVAEREEEADAS